MEETGFSSGGKELQSIEAIEASSHTQPIAKASTVLGNQENQSWLFQNLVSGMAIKLMKRLERALGVFNLEMRVLGFRNTLIRVVSPGSFLKPSPACPT